MTPKTLKPLSAQPTFDMSSFFAAPAPPLSKASASVPKALKPVKKEKEAAAVSATVKGKEVERVDATGPEGLLWIDRFCPKSRSELGVHPKKVTDVANWLTEAYNPKLAKYRRLLVLSGPSGAAKTATLRILADEFDIDILEYRNGSNLSFAVDDSRESMVNQFSNFLSRAGMAPALDFGPDPDDPSPVPSASTSSEFNPVPTSKRARRLILLEDLPNTSHFPTKLALRSALLQYLASPRVTCPLVVIISEALSRPGVGPDSESMSGESRRGESVDSRSVCGIEVLEKPGCREISFNPVAVTIMKKALVQVLDRVYSSSATGLPLSSRPSNQTLELIIAHSNGDIRSALMSLEFLSSNPELAGVTNLAGGMVKKGRKRKTDDSDGIGASDAQVKKLLQFVTARESSLFIFHLLGKVLYSKRWGQSADDDKKDVKRSEIQQLKVLDKLPRHLRAEWTRLPSKVNPDILFAEAPIDSDVFLSYVHHNYTAFTNEIEECVGIMESISAADGLMRMEGEDWMQRAILTSQYSFNVATRGTLLCLPSPVPRRSHVMRKADLWEKLRTTREREDGIEDMYRKKEGLAIVPAFEGGGGGGQRGRRSLVQEMVPWVGLIKRDVVKGSFVVELATFPPPPSSRLEGQITGEALREKETEDSDHSEKEDEDEEMDLDDAVAEGEQLFDPEDDIDEFD